MSYIRFDPNGRSPSGKTQQWYVTPSDNTETIGEVKWYGPWRAYAFFPWPDCVFEQKCLREIAEFIEHQTSEHRAAANLRKATVKT